MIFLAPYSVIGQTTHPQHVWWFRYLAQFRFNEKISWINEADNRRFLSPDAQLQFIFHSRVLYKHKEWNFASGLTLSWAYARFPTDPVEHATFEFRPVVEASHERSFRNISIQNRLRIDNRFFEADKKESIFDGYSYVARARYRLQFRFDMVQKKDGTPSVAVRIADEVMVNHRQNIFDQNRVYASVEIIPGRALSFEPGYIFIYQQRFGTEEFFMRHVWRLSLLHRFDLY